MLTSAPGAWRASKSQSLVMKIDHIPQLMWLTVASSSKFMLRPLCWLCCILTEFCVWNGDVWCIVPQHLLLMILPKFPSCFPKTSFPWLTVICCIFQASVRNKYTISLMPASMAYTLEIRDFNFFFALIEKLFMQYDRSSTMCAYRSCFRHATHLYLVKMEPLAINCLLRQYDCRLCPFMTTNILLRTERTNLYPYIKKYNNFVCF